MMRERVVEEESKKGGHTAHGQGKRQHLACWFEQHFNQEVFSNGIQQRVPRSSVTLLPASTTLFD